MSEHSKAGGISKIEKLKLKGLLTDFVKITQNLIQTFKNESIQGEEKYKVIESNWTDVSNLISQLQKFISNEYRANIARSVDSMVAILGNLKSSYSFATYEIDFSSCALNLLGLIKSSVAEISGSGAQESTPNTPVIENAKDRDFSGSPYGSMSDIRKAPPPVPKKPAELESKVESAKIETDIRNSTQEQKSPTLPSSLNDSMVGEKVEGVSLTLRNDPLLAKLRDVNRISPSSSIAVTSAGSSANNSNQTNNSVQISVPSSEPMAPPKPMLNTTTTSPLPPQSLPIGLGKPPNMASAPVSPPLQSATSTLYAASPSAQSARDIKPVSPEAAQFNDRQTIKNNQPSDPDSFAFKPVAGEYADACVALSKNYTACSQNNNAKLSVNVNDLCNTYCKYLTVFTKWLTSPNSSPEFQKIGAMIPDAKGSPIILTISAFDFTSWRGADLSKKCLIGRNTAEATGKPDFMGFSSQVVSRSHAEMMFSEGIFYVKDVGSNSGTFLNGRRLSGAGEQSGYIPIHCGDILQLGVDFRSPNVPFNNSHRCTQLVIITKLPGADKPNYNPGPSDESILLQQQQELKKEVEEKLLKQQKKMESHLKNIQTTSKLTAKVSAFDDDPMPPSPMSTVSAVISANTSMISQVSVKDSTNFTPPAATRMESFELKVKMANFSKSGQQGRMHFFQNNEELFAADYSGWSRGTVSFYREGNKKPVFEAIQSVHDQTQYKIIDCSQGRTLGTVEKLAINKSVLRPQGTDDPALIVSIIGDYKEGKFAYFVNDNVIGECTARSSYKKLGREYLRYFIEVDYSGSVELIELFTAVAIANK